MKVALVYDRVNKWGGAEKVLMALHEIWPEAPLFTSVYDPEKAPWAKGWDIRTTFLQNSILPKDRHEYYPFLMGPGFETLNFDEFDVVISVTHEFAKAIITKPKTLHICYCLTPASYLWEPGYSQYFYSRNLLKMISRPLVKYLRWYDKIISARPDDYVAISETVKSRIKKIYNRDSEVIYPPVDSPNSYKLSASSYFLIVSRLVPNKRVDLAIEAFNKLGWPLKIAGTGVLLDSLRQKANNNIEFLGFLTNEQLISYYEKCQGVIICGEEDFNIVAVEAQSFGKPVVAFNKGGVTETVIENKTGFFFNTQTPDSLAEVLKKSDFKTINPKDCIKNAEKYSKDRFKREFRDYVTRRYQQFLRDR